MYCNHTFTLCFSSVFAIYALPAVPVLVCVALCVLLRHSHLAATLKKRLNHTGPRRYKYLYYHNMSVCLSVQTTGALLASWYVQRNSQQFDSQ